MNQLKFISKYAPGKSVSAAQYITEIVCENNCKKNGQELPLRFWQMESWRQYYTFQIKCCNDLLKIVSPDVLLKFVRDKGIWNLSAKWVVESLEQLQRIHLAKQKQLARQKLEAREREYVEEHRGLDNKNVDLGYLN